MKFQIFLISSSVVLGSLIQGSCTSKMEDERISSRVSLAATELDGGAFSAFFSSGSGLPQLLSASSGSASGSSVLIPPGALNIDLTVTLAATTSLASAAQAGDLGIEALLASAGPAIFFQPSSTVELGVPMQLSLPILLSAALLDDDANYGVVYKSLGLKDGVETTYSGFIPRSEMVIQNGLAKVSVSRFGAYQVVKTSEPVTTRIEQPSTFAIGTAPGGNLVGTWVGPCVEKSKSSGTGSNPPTVTWYEQETLTFSATGTVTVSRKGNSYSNVCDTASHTYFEVSFDASFEVGGVVTTGTNVPQAAAESPRAFDAIPGTRYAQIFPYPSAYYPSDICGISGVFPSGKTEIPNDKCIAKIFDQSSVVTWDNTQRTEEKFLSIYVITTAASDIPPKLYLAESESDSPSTGRETTFSSTNFYTKLTTH